MQFIVSVWTKHAAKKLRWCHDPWKLIWHCLWGVIIVFQVNRKIRTILHIPDFYICSQVMGVVHVFCTDLETDCQRGMGMRIEVLGKNPYWMEESASLLLGRDLSRLGDSERKWWELTPLLAASFLFPISSSSRSASLSGFLILLSNPLWVLIVKNP